MTIDPEFAGFLNFLKEVGAPSTFSGTAEEARVRLSATLASHWDPNSLPKIGSVEFETVGAEATAVQIIRPATSRTAVPTILLFHPGGFTLGAEHLFEDTAYRIAHDLDAVVVLVKYRLAPEHRFPAAVKDAIGVVSWAYDNISRLGNDARKIALIGESSGANLATVAARHARDNGIPIAAQLLSVPYTDLSRDYPSVTENAEGYFLSKDDLAFVRKTYLAETDDPRSPDISPAHGRLDGLAPAIIGVAGFDPLRDDGIVYSAKLLQAGVPVQLRVYPGLIHPFFGMPGVSAGAKIAGDELLSLLSEAIERSDNT